MKRSTVIRFCIYGAVAVALAVLWERRNMHAVIPLDLHSSDGDYFGDGPVLDATIAADADTISEVSLRTILPGAGIHPLHLRMFRSGKMWRRVESLSDYRKVFADQAVRTSEDAESTSREFSNVAYLLAAFRFRYLPSHAEAPLGAPQIEVRRTDGSVRVYAFENQPPEFWAVVQSLQQINSEAEWISREITKGPHSERSDSP
jgi:hypothetical protein